MKEQPYPCPIQSVCERFFINMDAYGRRWQECRKCGRQINVMDYREPMRGLPMPTVSDTYLIREQLSSQPVRLEALDAKQIRKPAKVDGSGKSQSQVREEDWSARERGQRIQPSRRKQWKEELAKVKREKEANPQQ